MLVPWKESCDQPRQHINKQDITLPTNVHLVQLMVFPVVMYGCWESDYKESWVLKNWCFWTMVWRRVLRVPWTARRSNQLILKEINPNIHWKDWCWIWNSSILATWCEEPTHWKRPRFQERLKARGEGDDRGLDGWMASLTQCIWVWVNSRSWWWTGRPGVL